MRIAPGSELDPGARLRERPPPLAKIHALLRVGLPAVSVVRLLMDITHVFYIVEGVLAIAHKDVLYATAVANFLIGATVPVAITS